MNPIDLAQRYPTETLWILGILSLVTILGIVLVLMRSVNRSPAVEPSEPSEADPLATDEAGTASATGLAKSFRRALKRLDRFMPGAGGRYQIPWLLSLSTAGSQRLSLWPSSGINLPFGPPDDLSPGFDGCNWWFFDRGIVLDLGGNYVLRSDGRTADEPGLKRFLNLLKRHRPERPLDGLLVLLPCHQLRAAAEGGLEALGELEQQADRIYRAVWKTQREAAVRLPIYVMITGLEELPGFDDLAQALPERLQGEIFGWSNPHQIGVAYQTTWIEEAFEQIQQRLTNLQFEILAQPTPAGPVEGIFSLPTAVDSIREPVQRTLRQLFKSSAYHDTMLFRGLYLCGFQKASQSSPSRTLFLSDLMEQKVFRESVLASPTGSVFTARNRKVQTAQAGLLLAALILGFGSYFSYRHLDRNRSVLKSFLESSQNDLNETHRVLQSDADLDIVLERARSMGLIDGLTQLDINHFRSIFLPVSWFSDFDSRLREAILGSFQGVVFRSMQHKLGERLEKLTQNALSSPYAAPPASPPAFATEAAQWRARLPDGGVESLPIAESPELRDLHEYATQLTELERQAQLFNSLPKTGDLRDFGRLVEFLYQYSPPEPFYEKSQLYQRALHNPDNQLKWKNHQGDAVVKVEALAHRFHHSVFSQGQLGLELESLSAALNNLVGQQWDLGRDQEPIRQVILASKKLSESLAEPQFEWAFQTPFSLGNAYDTALAAIASSSLLGPELAGSIRREGEAEWASYRRRLEGFEAILTGPLLRRDEDGRLWMELSPDVQLLSTVLEDFLQERFMQDSSRRALRSTPPGSRLMWDTLILEQAVASYEPYEQFRAQKEVHFPPRFTKILGGSLDTLARRSLGRRLTNLVARAQTFEPIPTAVAPLLLEEELRSEIAGFDAASGLLSQVLTTFDQLSLTRERQDLARIMSLQSIKLLETTDRILTSETLYRPRHGNLSWWQGDGSLALSAYEVAGPQELEVYLERQRRRVSQLAGDYAKPLITWLAKSAMHRRPPYRPIYDRWERILLQLADYDLKQPGTSVAELEQFVTETLATAELQSCPDIVRVKPPARVDADYFAKRLDQLRLDLSNQCRRLALEHGSREYEAIERFFNQRLAGRYPFHGESVPGKPEVTEADLKAFFELFDQRSALLSSVGGDLQTVGGSVSQFFDRMQKVRAFVGHFLDAEVPSSEIIFDFDLDFRVNSDYEDQGHQIIDWRLEVGEWQEPERIHWDQAVTHRDLEPAGRWVVGRPLRLSLRWAKDSPRIPVSVTPSLPKAVIKDRTVIWELHNRWSLLSLLQGLAGAPADFDQLEDSQPHTLKMTLATRVDETPEGAIELTPGPKDDVPPTQVFIRLRTLAPETQTPLQAPFFPTSAPRLDRRSPEAAETEPARQAPVRTSSLEVDETLLADGRSSR